MTYRIDARLEQGAPSLVLVDAITGEERLHWRNQKTTAEDGLDWQDLFKRLVLLCCADRLSSVEPETFSKINCECPADCQVLTDTKNMVTNDGRVA